jgi:hypothetical protein
MSCAAQRSQQAPRRRHENTRQAACLFDPIGGAGALPLFLAPGTNAHTPASPHARTPTRSHSHTLSRSHKLPHVRRRSERHRSRSQRRRSRFSATGQSRCGTLAHPLETLRARPRAAHLNVLARAHLASVRRWPLHLARIAAAPRPGVDAQTALVRVHVEDRVRRGAWNLHRDLELPAALLGLQTVWERARRRGRSRCRTRTGRSRFGAPGDSRGLLLARTHRRPYPPPAPSGLYALSLARSLSVPSLPGGRRGRKYTSLLEFARHGVG